MKKNKLMLDDKIEVKDLVPNPILIKNKNNVEVVTEKALHLQKYMNYIDKNVKEINNNSTIGILICKRENKFVIEYCLDERIAIIEYELV